MPSLLPDWESVVDWFPEETDPMEVHGLVNWVNQHAAEALTYPVAINWLGQVANTVHGFLVTVLGRPYVTVMFHIEHHKPVVGCCGLANYGAIIESHGDYAGETRKRLSSPGELVQTLFSPDARSPNYTQWATAMLSDYLRERGRVHAALDMAAFRDGLNRVYKEVCKAMELALPAVELRRQLGIGIVGDQRLVDFLDCLARHNLLGERSLVRRLLNDYENAARIWAAVTDSHERLAPLMLAALPHLAPVNAKASTLLKRLGIGKGLSKRLRALRADQMPKLLEWVYECRDLDFTIAFFRHLGAAWPQLPAVKEAFESERFNFLLALSNRLAQLEKWARQGRCGLPREAIYAICPFPPNGERLDPDRLDASVTDEISLTNLTHILQAVFRALMQAACHADLRWIIDRLDHSLDWLSHNESNLSIPPSISLGNLAARADDWVQHVDLDRIPNYTWRCLLQDNAEWKPIEAAITGAFSIIPLCNTGALVNESLHMKHCAAPSYWERSTDGQTRLFSIRRQDQRYATVELSFHNSWQCIQIKGIQNLELTHHLEKRDSVIGRLIRELVRFYNRYQPEPYASVRESKGATALHLTHVDIPAFVRRTDIDMETTTTANA